MQTICSRLLRPHLWYRSRKLGRVPSVTPPGVTLIYDLRWLTRLKTQESNSKSSLTSWRIDSWRRLPKTEPVCFTLPQTFSKKTSCVLKACMEYAMNYHWRNFTIVWNRLLPMVSKPTSSVSPCPSLSKSEKSSEVSKSSMFSASTKKIHTWPHEKTRSKWKRTWPSIGSTSFTTFAGSFTQVWPMKWPSYRLSRWPKITLTMIRTNLSKYGEGKSCLSPWKISTSRLS